MISILINYIQLNSWREALLKVLPQRKIGTEGHLSKKQRRKKNSVINKESGEEEGEDDEGEEEEN